MRREETDEPLLTRMGNFERRHRRVFRAGVFDFLERSEGLEGRDHRFAARERRAACIRPEFPEAGIGRNDEGAEDHENDLEEIHEEHVAGETSAAAFAIPPEPRNGVGEDAGQEHDEGVHNALEERHRHHVAVRNVGHLVGKHPLDFVLLHSLKKACRDGDERAALRRARRERVHLVRAVNPHFGHRHVGAAGQFTNRVQEMAEFRVLGFGVDDLDAQHPLRHDSRQRKRDERPPHAPDEAEDQERLHVNAVGGQKRLDVQEVEDERDHQDHEEVQREEEENPFCYSHKPIF